METGLQKGKPVTGKESDGHTKQTVYKKRQKKK
jgi:hypothetical protein